MRGAGLTLLAVLLALDVRAAKVEPVEFIYAGTWTNLESEGAHPQFSQGIYGWRFDPERESYESLGVVAEAIQPDSLAASPDGRYLYATQHNGCICTRSWPFPGAPRPEIAAYAIDATTGKLTLLNRVDARGDMPAGMKVDRTGKVLAAANYYGGNVVTFRIGADGRLSEAVDMHRHSGTSVHASAGPHPHGLEFSRDNRFLYVPDQGLDRVYSYRFDAGTAVLTPAAPTYAQLDAGMGPRHVAVHPNDRWIYVNTEQAGMEIVFESANGRLKELQRIPILPPDAKRILGSAESKISPDGRFLYVNHRIGELITVFAIDQDTGRLTTVQHAASDKGADKIPWEGKTQFQKVQTGARAFDWSEHADWVASANFGENALVILRRESRSGKLSSPVEILEVPQPTFVLFVRPAQ